MSEKGYFDEMKKLLKEEKKLVYGGLIFIAVLAIALGAWLISRNHFGQQSGMTGLLSAHLEEAGFPCLPEEQIDEVSETAVKILDKMVRTETDQGKMIQAVKEAILKLNMEVSDSEAEELAAWLVDQYLDNYTEVYGEEENINASLLAGHTLLEQMEQDLVSMQEYLNTLDQSVQKNQSELSEMSGTQNSNHTAMQEYLYKMETLVTNLQKEFNSYTGSYETGQNSSKTEFAGIKSELTRLQTDISETQKALEDDIKNTDANNGGRYEAVREKVNSLQTSVQDGLSSVKDSLGKEIAALEKDSSTASKSLAEKLEVLMKELSELENEAAQRDSQLTQNVDEHVNELNTLLDSIHSNIGQSQKEIQDMLSAMTVQDTAHMNEIMEWFEQINTDVAGINSQMDTAHAELKSLIVALQKSEDENHAELLTRLGTMDSSFEQKNEENYQNLLSSLQTQTADFRSAMDSLGDTLETNVSVIHQDVVSSKEEMLQRMSVMENSLSTSLNTSVTNLSVGMNGNQETVLNRIAEMETGMSQNMAGIQNDLQSVFQSVSNGKALLASALLTKNVTIGEDASFQEIYDAIIAVPQEIILGETQIPGNIEYEYHYHTGDSVDGGGCYTVEDVHQHVGSCYVTCSYTNGGCVEEGNYLVDNYIHCPYEYKHSYCTSGSWVKGEYVHINDGKHHKAGSSGTHLVVVCGKTEGTHYGWKTGCGLNDDQIIGAKITYDANAVSSTAESTGL